MMVYSDTDHGRLRDIDLALDVVGKHYARLRSQRDKLATSFIKPAERQIGDHAIIRYLERVESMDIEALKARIRLYIEAMDRTPVRGVLRHPASGIQAITNRQGIVVTLLPDGSEMGYESADWRQEQQP